MKKLRTLVIAAQIEAAAKKSENVTTLGQQIMEEQSLHLQQSMELMKQMEPYWKRSDAAKSPEERARTLAPAFGLLREYIIKRQGRLKSLLPAAAEIDAAGKAHLSLAKTTAKAAAIQPDHLTWQIANEYLEMTGKALKGNP